MSDRSSSAGKWPFIVVVAGVPGSGKTTLVRQVLSTEPLRLVCRDEIRMAMFQPCSLTQEERSAAFRAMLDAMEVNIKLGSSCITDGMPFSRDGELESVEQVGTALGVPVESFLLECPVGLAMDRIAHSLRHNTTLSGRPAADDRTPELVRTVAERFRRFPIRTSVLDATMSPHQLGTLVLEHLKQRGLRVSRSL